MAMTEDELLAQMGLQPQPNQSSYDLSSIMQAMAPNAKPQLSTETRIKQKIPLQNVAGPVMNIAAPKTAMSGELFAQLMQRQTQGLEAQRAGLGQFDEQLKQIQGAAPSQGTQVLAALSDLVGGGNAFAGTQNAAAVNRKQAMELQQNVQKYKNDLTDKEIDLLKAQFQNQGEQEKMAMMEKLARLKLGNEKEKDAKTLTSSETEQLADLKNQIGSLENIYSDWATKVGPSHGVEDYIGGKAMGLLPNTDASQYKANLRQKAQLIGKALEGGKLTDVDYEKYIKFLPQIGDTEETAKGRVEELRKTMVSSYQNRVKTFGEAGYKVSGFSDIKDVSFNKKKAPGGGPKVGDVVEGYKYVGGDPSKPESWAK